MSKRIEKGKGSQIDKSKGVPKQAVGNTPKAPVSREEWLDETIRQDFFKKDMDKRERHAPGRVDGELHFIRLEPRIGDRVLIDPGCILRFRNERREFPLSETQFVFPRQMTQSWQQWVDYIVKDSRYTTILKKAGVHDAIRATSRFHFPLVKDMELWRAILACWSAQTHTFVMTWGEVTPTLEDVSMLLNFLDFGLTDIATANVSEEDEGLILQLNKYMKTTMDTRRHVMFFSWVRYFFGQVPKVGEEIIGPRRKSVHMFIAFLTCWLSIYVFPGGPEKSISPRFFHLEIRISRGERFALGPFYLGSLYRRLDLYHEASIRSKGRHIVVSHVDLVFLQLFFCERYKKFYNSPSPPYDPPNPRAWGWIDRKPLGSLLDVMDNIRNFIFRPYTKEIVGYEYCSHFYPLGSTKEVYLLEARSTLSDAEVGYIMWCTPGGLPSLHDRCHPSDPSKCMLEQKVMAYSPDRVAHQFGFDQGVPRVLIVTESFDTCCKALYPKSYKDIRPNTRQMFFPSIDREGVISARWLTYWSLCLEEFESFTSSKVEINLQVAPISKNEFYLRPLSQKPSDDSQSHHAPSPPLAVRQPKRSRFHEDEIRGSEANISDIEKSKEKTSSNAITRVSEHPIDARPHTVLRPLPQRYGVGKVLQIKDHNEPIVTIDDKDNDIEDNHDLTTEGQEGLASDDEERTNASIEELDDNDSLGELGDIVPEDLDLDITLFNHLDEGLHAAHASTSVVCNTPRPPNATLSSKVSTGVPPLVSDAPQRVESSMSSARANDTEEYALFHGSRVLSRFLPSLERLHMIEGGFWNGAIRLGSGPTNCIVAVLGEAAKLLDKCWSSLHIEDLELLVSSVDVARAFKFNISKMDIIASEAKKILSCEELSKQRNHHKAEVTRITLEIEKRLGNINVDATVKSTIGL